MWRRYQPNPDKLITGDCTVRAICAVTGMDWRTAHTALCELARDMADMPSSNRVWWAFLKAIGFRQLHLMDRCPDCFTVKDFAEANPKGVYVLGPHEHAVAVIDGQWLDSWDSGDTVPLYYFIKEENDVPADKSRVDESVPGGADDGAADASDAAAADEDG